MTCIRVICILFMNFYLCAYLYISLCIEVILSLFMRLCLSCILSWIIWVEFVMTLNIHQVLWVSLEEYSIHVILSNFIYLFCLFMFFFCLFIYLFIYFSTQIIVIIYLFVHILRCLQMEKEDRHMGRLCVHQ